MKNKLTPFLIVTALLALLFLSSCAFEQKVTDTAIRKVVPQETKQAADFVVKAIEADRAELALEPAKAVSEKIGVPKEPLELPTAPAEGEPETEEAKVEAAVIAEAATKSTNAGWAGILLVFHTISGIFAAASRG